MAQTTTTTIINRDGMITIVYSIAVKDVTYTPDQAQQLIRSLRNARKRALKEASIKRNAIAQYEKRKNANISDDK